MVNYWPPILGQPDTIQVWDWQRKKVVFQPPFPGVRSRDFRPDGQQLAFGQDDGTITVVDVGSWNEVARLKVDFPATLLAYHPDCNRLAVGSHSGGTIAVCDVVTGKRLYQVSAPGLNSLAWHPRGDLLVGGSGKHLHRWDAATGLAHAVVSSPEQSGFSALAFAANGDILTSEAGDGSSSRLWDPWTGRELLRFVGASRYVSRDGYRLATRAGHTLAVWDLSPGREYLTMPSGAAAYSSVAVGAIGPDGRWLLGGRDRCLVWDLALRKAVGALPVRSSLTGAKFHPTRQEFFTSSQDGLYRWSFEVTDGALRIRPTSRLLPPGNWAQLSLDREGGLLAVHRGGHSGGVAILDLKGPSGSVRPLEHINAMSASLSPDGRWVAAGAHNGFGIKVWDARTGKAEKELIRNESSR